MSPARPDEQTEAVEPFVMVAADNATDGSADQESGVCTPDGMCS